MTCERRYSWTAGTGDWAPKLTMPVPGAAQTVSTGEELQGLVDGQIAVERKLLRHVASLNKCLGHR